MKGFKKWKEHIEQWGLDSAYKHELELGGKLNTDGWSGSIYYLKQSSKTENTLWQLSFSEIKHEKQIKQQYGNNYPKLGNASPYLFGKINNLYTLQLGLGKEQLLLPTVIEGNMSINFRYSAGLSIAMLKPYYLKLVYVDYTPTEVDHIQEEKYSNTNSDKFTNSGYILGASKWSRGLDEIQYIPGAFAEIAMTIEPTKNKIFIQTISIGANGAFYAKSLPIMADQQSYPWQASLFIGLSIGKKWR